MPGAFTGTASLTISQMEKMLTVFLPLYELSIFRPGSQFEFVERTRRQHGFSRRKWAHLAANGSEP
jgi:hypothetical protein